MGKLTGKKIILFGAGKIGKKALKYINKYRVFCFVDNNVNDTNRTYLNKPVYTFNQLLEIHTHYDVVITVANKNVIEIIEQCSKYGISYILLEDILYDGGYSHECYESDPIIQQFKNKHIGKRCFLIGNGPSLSMKDLDILHMNNEISFGCNAISRAFSDTLWRPNYFAVQDKVFFEYQYEMLANTDVEYKFFPDLYVYTNRFSPRQVINTLTHGKGKTILFQQIRPTEEESLLFSPDASKALYLCGTIMYAMMQLAVYMGCREIYLLGVDGGTSSPINQNEYLSKKRHFYAEDEQWLNQFTYDANHTSDFIKQNVDKAYEAAELFTRNNGFIIKNATPGSTIKTFETVNFHSLF